LAKDAVADLVKTHVFTLKDVIDAQAAKNFVRAYATERTAADHMAMMASALAGTVVAQFPDKF
ncbi:MAG TPA: copper amine oxidase, partial [Acidimicrobiia bacterium]|nr:copper amine oxidase [Acidimicrobiia bacterium]